MHSGTPVAGIIHAITLLFIMLVFGHWASLIPMPVLAAILILVSYTMSEWRSFVKILKSPRSDVAIMLVTFLFTVIVDLTVAIEVGIVLAALLFMKRMSEVSHVNAITRDLQEERDEEEEGDGKQAIPKGVELFEVYGSLFFGAVDQFTESMRFIGEKPNVLILQTRYLFAVDASGLRAVEELLHQRKHRGTTLLISGIHKQPLFAMTNSGLYDKIGEDNICGNLEEAVERATTILAK